MHSISEETRALCPECAQECPAWYTAGPDGLHLHFECAAHGHRSEHVERDPTFFRLGYEQDYERPHSHFVLPATYRCNLRCTYCYTLSNCLSVIPQDRDIDTLAKLVTDFDGNVTLIGGEPTVRNDLPELIARCKRLRPRQKLSIGTNGQKLRDAAYATRLREAGLDFVFLSLNDPAYEPAPAVFPNKMRALQNCRRLGLPVWLQRTIGALPELNSIRRVINAYRRTVFAVTIRAVKPFGVSRPTRPIFLSDMLAHLGLRDRCEKGTMPFNRFALLDGKRVKFTSWVNDVRRVDPLDSAYLISDNSMTTFHRGMKTDEVLLRRRLAQAQA